MLTKQHEIKFQIYDVDRLTNEKATRIRRHGPLFPNSIRAIICGPSNCGKSNVMMSLLYSPDGIKFSNLYVYSKSLHQPKYQLLESILSDIPGVGFYPFKENNEIMTPSEAEKNSVFIFDDVANDKQEKIRDFFSMGRHSDVDSFFLIQSYTRALKHMVRDNANFLILFKQDDLNLKHVYNDHVSSDMKFDVFKNMCLECWKENYGFLTICKDFDANDGRYRQGIDRYIYQE